MSEDDNVDLGMLEKRLAEKRESQRASAAPGSNPTSPSQVSQADGNGSTPRSSIASPEPQVKNGDKLASEAPEKSEEEVEALSDMMCSLVTNNCGETRYIGTDVWRGILLFTDLNRIFLWILHLLA